jgi:hypothetical protein
MQPQNENCQYILTENVQPAFSVQFNLQDAAILSIL